MSHFNFENRNSNQNKTINLTQFVFNPNPIEIGKNLIAKVVGSNTVKIQSGTIMSTYFCYKSKLVDSRYIDLCIELIKSNGVKYPNISTQSAPAVVVNYLDAITGNNSLSIKYKHDTKCND